MSLIEIAPQLSCYIHVGYENDEESSLQQALSLGYKQIYIQGKDGIYMHHVLRDGKDGAPRFIRLPVTEVPGLKIKEISPEVRFLPEGKIPRRLLKEVESFFSQVIDRMKTPVEAMIWILWSQEKGYYLHVPNQVVSKASASYDWSSVPADSSIIVDIHSHADFSAFFSGTDDRDDSNCIRYSVVIGHNDKPERSYKARFTYMSTRKEVSLDNIFGPDEPVNVPEEWFDKIKSPSYSYGHGNYVGHPGRGASRMDAGTPVAYAGGYPGFTQGPSQVQGMAQNRGVSNNGQVFRGRQNNHHSPGSHMTAPQTTAGHTSSDKSGSGEGASEKKAFGGPQTGSPQIVQFPDLNHFPLGILVIKGNNKYVRVEEGFQLVVENFAGTANVVHSYGPPRSIENGLSRSSEDVIDRMQDDLYPTDRPDDDESITSTHGFSNEEIALAGAYYANMAQQSDNLDANAINHGPGPALAHAVIELASTELAGSTLLHDSVAEMFKLVEDTDKLDVIRRLVELLPAREQMLLQQQGL